MLNSSNSEDENNPITVVYPVVALGNSKLVHL